MRQEDGQGVVRAMDQHGQLQRTGPVVDIAHQAAYQESREALPDVHVDRGEENCLDEYGKRRIHPARLLGSERVCAFVVEKSPEDDSPAEPFLAQGRHHRGKEQAEPQRAARQDVH